MRKPIVFFLAVLLALSGLCGCGSASQGPIIKYDIPGAVANLDPQFATDTTARMIIGNLYEGLVVQKPDGSIALGAAEDYTVSADGYTYTFTLREGVCWSDGKPLTSADFAFTFRRLFSEEAPSPYASEYSCIQNASAVLQGEMGVSGLGIHTPDERTVVFTLEYQSPFFLELLAATPAMPCNEEVFEDARGLYGLKIAYVYSNGPFSLSRWDNESVIQIRRDDAYVSQDAALAGGVNFYIARNDPVEQFADGNSDLVTVSYERLQDLERLAPSYQYFDKTAWCIVFNQNDPVLGSALVRQGLAHALDPEELGAVLTPNFTTTRVFVPPAVQLAGESYRERTGSQALIPYDTGRGAYLFDLGLESLEVSALPDLTLLVPDSSYHAKNVGLAQQDWQRYLGAYVTIESVSAAEIQERFRAGSYQMLLMPFSPSGGGLGSLLGAFTSSSPQNFTGYRNPLYDIVLADASVKTSVSEIADCYYLAESMLLSDTVVLPVYFETTTYAISKKVNGIAFSPFGDLIYFKYAEKN